MHYPILLFIIIFAFLADIRLVFDIFVDVNTEATIEIIVDVADAVTAPAAGDSSNYNILKSSTYALYH